MPTMAKILEKTNLKIVVMMTVLLVFALSTAAGCSSPKPAVKNPSVQEISEEIKQAVDISGMREGDRGQLEKLYGIDADELEGFALYTAPSNIKADEIAVLKASDPGNVESIKNKISKRLENKADSFRDYLPEEYFLIEKHVLKTHGNYILFVVSKDAEKIESVFSNIFI